MTWLAYLTIDTGHVIRVPRIAIDPAALAVVRQVIDAALDQGQAPMQPDALAHFTLKATAQGRKLIATMLGPAGPHEPGRPYHGRLAPLVTIGVAPKSLDSAKLWPLLLEDITMPPERPGAPWAAVRFHPALAKFGDAPAWLGDFGGCLAWAWLDRIEEGHDD